MINDLGLINRPKFLKGAFILAFLILSSLILNLKSANAQGLSVGIDPPILHINAEAPALINSQISIQNESDQNITYSIFLMPFKQSAETSGVPEFDKSLLPDYKNIFKRIQVLDESRVITEVKLAPKQKKDLNLRIIIAKDEKPSDYYFSVLFISSADSKSETNSFSGSRAGIATNVLLSVGPKTQTTGSIKEFSSPKFVTKGPVEFKVRLANTSSHYIPIKGNVVVKNMFGQIVGNIDFPPVNVLSNSERLLGSPLLYWDEKFLMGIYNADLTIALSEDGPILSKSLTFLALPLELILGIIVTLVLIIGIIRRVRKKETE